MTNLETLQQTIAQLPAKDLAEFRRWFAEFDAAAWDAQIEADANAGKLEDLAAEALAERQARKATRPHDGTAYLLQSPANAKRLFDAMKSLDKKGES